MEMCSTGGHDGLGISSVGSMVQRWLDGDVLNRWPRWPRHKRCEQYGARHERVGSESNMDGEWVGGNRRKWVHRR
jgi:D-arabinose 1-dehydrogenase-like Zn-dependent alcohol dehydrogenase